MVRTKQQEPPAGEQARIARRERRRAQSREQILAATRTILTREGTAGFTLEAVASELHLTKAALYHYFPSKDALLFEAIHGELLAEAEAIATAVEGADSGAEALRALVETAVAHYRDRLDTFRLAYLYPQVAGPSLLHPSHQQIDKMRPINDLIYGNAERKLRADGRPRKGDPDPRRLAFLAHMAAIGLLTMKGLVEGYGDPLVHSDADLVEDLARTLAAAVPSKRGAAA